MAAATESNLYGCHDVTALQTKTAMTKDKFNWKFCLCCGLFIWFVVNLLQGIFTEIQEDEAYYALYGEHLAWGYFDHPPMVGLMTFLSSIFFSGSLGVRFFTIIVSCLSLWVMWLIANDRLFDRLRNPNGIEVKAVEPVETPTSKNIFLFFTIACSIVMFNIYGFVATPDAALILFSALFLLVYQSYLQEKTWKNALLMGVLMALMIYSKYHAFLLLGLLVLSNLKLLKDGRFYVACLLALVLLTPHIMWQVSNGFPSFKYHLSQRSDPFRWSYFLEYLPNQLLIFNPFTFGAVVYALIKQSYERVTKTEAGYPTPAENQVFERGLRFILVGFFFFFWLMTFRGHVEPHWTIVCVIPVTILIYRKSLIDEKLRKFIKHFVQPSLLMVLAVRIILLTPWVDRFGYHGKEAYYQAIEQVAGDRPVVFRGSFQKPALYHYFTGKESSSLKCYYDRMTQYDLWQFDKSWTGQEVFVCGPVNGLSKKYQIDDISFEGYLMQPYRSPNRLVTRFEITNANPQEPVFHHGDTIQLDFSIYNPSDAPIAFHHEMFNMILKAHYLPGDAVSYCFYDNIPEIGAQTTYHGHLFTVVNDEICVGKYRFNLGIGDRISSFVTEESGLKIRIEP